MNHHITRRDGRWEVWYSGSEGKQLAATSPYSIMDAWEKSKLWHARKAGEACLGSEFFKYWPGQGDRT